MELSVMGFFFGCGEIDGTGSKKSLQGHGFLQAVILSYRVQ